MRYETIYVDLGTVAAKSTGTPTAFEVPGGLPGRIVDVQFSATVDAGGSVGPGGYAAEGLTYLKGYIKTAAESPVFYPKNEEIPVELWQGEPVKPVDLTQNGGTVYVENVHPSKGADVMCRMVLEVEGGRC